MEIPQGDTLEKSGKQNPKMGFKSPRGGINRGQPFTYDLFDSLKTFRVLASWAFVRLILWATESLLGIRNNAAISS